MWFFKGSLVELPGWDLDKTLRMKGSQWDHLSGFLLAPMFWILMGNHYTTERFPITSVGGFWVEPSLMVLGINLYIEFWVATGGTFIKLVN